jgi:hypothetical protein
MGVGNRPIRTPAVALFLQKTQYSLKSKYFQSILYKYGSPQGNPISIVLSNRSTSTPMISLLFAAIWGMQRSAPAISMEMLPLHIPLVMAALKQFPNTNFRRREFLQILLISSFMMNLTLTGGQT